MIKVNLIYPIILCCCLAAVPQVRAKHLLEFIAESANNEIEKQVETYDFSSCQIYCYGPLLHTVQMAKLFPDSKTFVDMKLKASPEKTMELFEAFMASTNNTPTNDQIRKFVDDNFGAKGTELEVWTPTDWVEHPAFLDLVNDPDLKQWGVDLNNIWKELGRKMKDDVHKNPEYYSIIPVPNPVIIPGGRFIEFYYWDSYWIIRGLLYSEMRDTARGMIENFMSIVQRIGFIPNGGRVYYWGRSQPPLLAGMVKSYVDFTKDDRFAINALDVLEHEFEYFINNHSVQAKGYNLAVYRDSSKGPRPESYSEDIETAATFNTDEDKENHYSELKSAAESGMDFSSRWYINEEGTNVGNLSVTKTRSIVPVDLNSILYWNAKIIAEFHAKAGNVDKMTEYETKAQKIKEAIQAVLWNEEAGCWLDYDLINEKPRDYFVTSNLAPLWVKAYNISDTDKISASVLNYIEKNKLDTFPGGIPNTLYQTGEQWDFPNVWAPLQYIIIEGLDNLGTPDAKQLSKRWGHRWVKSNFAAYRDSRAMFEKYDAEKFGGHGGGGEYGVQKGFGWTNGVIIEWLAKYGHEISLSNTGAAGPSSRFLSLLGVTAVALIGAFAGHLIW
ncbi:trehalase isoform X1 [Drosophila mojavensis]|uniref:Trehalase n=1 Tax=Drosophila mojavensis TaxID=7230 RepID=A0A0Q9XHW5_DROMO|nr:trehalase isoform X1 [Drosophila mojavensis]KRG04852.1 uncharacterized protein Dmoj_GI20651, isoform E [Drosophila mojavensis]